MPARPAASRSSVLWAVWGLALIGLLTGRGTTRSSQVLDRGVPGAERQRDHGPSDAAPEPSGAGRERDRGREATTPTDIPAKGWKDILWRAYEEINKDRILAVAAGVTFYALLALFPAIGALISIYGLFADPATIAEHLDVSISTIGLVVTAYALGIAVGSDGPIERADQTAARPPSMPLWPGTPAA